MDVRRRMVGLALIVLVVSGSALVPQLGSRPMSGVAEPVPVPEPPAVGQCVPATGDTPWIPQDAVAQGPGTHSYSYPQLPIGKCSGLRYGEVVAVIAHPDRPLVTVGRDGTITALTDSNLVSCDSAALSYIGSPTVGIGVVTDLGYWHLAPSIEVTGSRPSYRQESAGQHWLACIAFLRQDAYGGVSDLPPAYQSTVRGAVETGYYRNQLGVCEAAVDVRASMSTACSDPHLAETFGWWRTGKTPVSRAALIDSCAGLISRLTRLPDITARRTLAVQMQVTDESGRSTTGPEIPADRYATCSLAVTGGRQLTGSLLALGARPLPWA